MIYIDTKTAHELFDYPTLCNKLLIAHQTPTDITEDLLLATDHKEIKNHFFIRAAWQKNSYLGVKNITIFPQNRTDLNIPSIQAIYTLFDAKSGSPLCCIDGTALTAIKTATDSALGSMLLARNDVKTMLMIGAGSMSKHLIKAHCSIRPSIENVYIWNRTSERCNDVIESLKELDVDISVAHDLPEVMQRSDMISSAVTTSKPYIKGQLLKQGCHVDLVGSFTEDLRESDDETMKRGSLFVDSRKMTLGIVGELVIPMSQGVIDEDDIKADFYDAAVGDKFCRSDQNEITVFKNGGGGHLDLMVAHILYNRYIDKN